MFSRIGCLAFVLMAAFALAPAVRAADKVKFGTLDTPKVVYIGIEKGFFAKENIEIETVTFRSGAALVPAISSGQIDVAATSPGAALYNAIARGVDVTIVADYFQPDKNGPGGDATAIVVRKDLVDSGAFKDAKSAKGMTVAITARGQITDLLMNRFLQSGGLTGSDVRVVTMPYPDMLAALKGKAIDIAVSIDPYLEIAVREHLAVVQRYASELMPGLTQGVLIFAPRLARDNRELGERFMRGFVASNSWVRKAWATPEGRAEIARIYQKYVPMQDASTYQRIGLSVGPENVAVDVDGPTGLKAQMQWYASQGLIPKLPDLGKAVDNSFASSAMRGAKGTAR